MTFAEQAGANQQVLVDAVINLAKSHFSGSILSDVLTEQGLAQAYYNELNVWEMIQVLAEELVMRDYKLVKA